MSAQGGWYSNEAQGAHRVGLGRVSKEARINSLGILDMWWWMAPQFDFGTIGGIKRRPSRIYLEGK